VGDREDTLGLRSVASRLRVRGHARSVGRRAIGPPICVHQLFGPRLNRQRRGDRRLWRRLARAPEGGRGRAPSGLASPPGSRSRPELGQSHQARPEEAQRASWSPSKEAALTMLPRSDVDAFEMQIKELLVAVPGVAREGLMPGGARHNYATWRQRHRRMRPECVPERR
jgi:hypothetical protein